MSDLLGFAGFSLPAGSDTDEWFTPLSIIDALGGADSFDLDPASAEHRPWPTARLHYTEADNGLLRPWHGRVFLNPPYSNALLTRFMQRMAGHDDGVALLFLRTQNATWHEHILPNVSALYYLRGYVRFCRRDGKAAKQGGGAPSVLCAYGADEADRLSSLSLPGYFQAMQLPRAFAMLALSATWREAVLAYLKAHNGPVQLADLYRAFAGSAKARRNPNHRAKLRQTVQQVGRRVGRGLWEAAA